MRSYEGVAEKFRRPVLSNALDIPSRLKELDQAYFVMFNILTQKYEIHCAWQIGSTLACELPFDALDGRAIEYAKAFSRENTQHIADEIEDYNRRLEMKREAEV